MRRLGLLLCVLGTAAVVAALAGVGRPTPARADTPPAKTVTATGHGVVIAVPDEATVTAGVSVTRRTAAAALSRCSALTARVIAALRRAGGTQLQTQQVSLWPQTSESGRVIGYVAENDVNATAPIAGAGRLVDAAVASGANTVNGPSLSVGDRDTLYQQALAKALADARGKAETLAKAGGFGLGAVLSVTEQSEEPGPIPFAGAMHAKAATPVVPGTQQVTADVQASFAIA